MERITINTELVVLTLNDVRSRKYKGKEIKIYQLERGSGSGYYVAEIGPKRQYDEDDEEENMNEHDNDNKNTVNQMIIDRLRANSESLLADDESFHCFVERVETTANKLIESDDCEIIGISYPDKFSAIISYK